MRWSKHKSVVGSLEGCDVVTVLVGEEEREFTIHRKILFDSCPFFRSYLDEIPNPSKPQDGSASSNSSSSDSDEEEDSALLLPSEAPDMFELFVLWLYQRRRFPFILDKAIQTMNPDKARTLRNDLVRLHLFAAMVDLPALQDAAMDALQDMYLRFDWDMSPRFLAFLYGDCDAQHAMRLRRWAVAMLAWTLHGPEKSVPTCTTPPGTGLTTTTTTSNSATTDFNKLFAAYPELQSDYHMHLHKMAMSRADVRVKNPQLRLPANKLQSGERYFGFRQCTFHSHRASVGEGMCPHALAAMVSTQHPLPAKLPELRGPPPGRKLPPPPPMTMAMAMARDVRDVRDVRGRDKEEVVSDKDEEEVEQLLISPVGDLNEISYLDLS
ncbi:hypothetical protein VTJ49DRAFT_3248 [Mycothermus thermophilus]|uniref:BTB domain-containing protein n=1 Tax=Humicola insolens TaxID=85995 RepID=A0ABR3V822_HUMIN